MRKKRQRIKKKQKPWVRQRKTPMGLRKYVTQKKKEVILCGIGFWTKTE